MCGRHGEQWETLLWTYCGRHGEQWETLLWTYVWQTRRTVRNITVDLLWQTRRTVRNITVDLCVADAENSEAHYCGLMCGRRGEQWSTLLWTYVWQTRRTVKHITVDLCVADAENSEAHYCGLVCGRRGEQWRTLLWTYVWQTRRTVKHITVDLCVADTENSEGHYCGLIVADAENSEAHYCGLMCGRHGECCFLWLFLSSDPGYMAKNAGTATPRRQQTCTTVSSSSHTSPVWRDGSSETTTDYQSPLGLLQKPVDWVFQHGSAHKQRYWWVTPQIPSHGYQPVFHIIDWYRVYRVSQNKCPLWQNMTLSHLVLEQN